MGKGGVGKGDAFEASLGREQEAAARRAVEREDAAVRQRHAEEERRAMELLQKEERLRSKERELTRIAKELEVTQCVYTNIPC